MGFLQTRRVPGKNFGSLTMCKTRRCDGIKTLSSDMKQLDWQSQLRSVPTQTPKEQRVASFTVWNRPLPALCKETPPTLQGHIKEIPRKEHSDAVLLGNSNFVEERLILQASRRNCQAVEPHRQIASVLPCRSLPALSKPHTSPKLCNLAKECTGMHSIKQSRDISRRTRKKATLRLYAVVGSRSHLSGRDACPDPQLSYL